MTGSNLQFHANGKLLLTGEYLVLDGAEALAIPLCVGQSLEVTREDSREEKIVHWKALEGDQIWFESELDMNTFRVLHSTDDYKAKYLLDLLVQAKLLNRSFLDKNGKYKVVTQLEFNRNWGLGSSSTLIQLIAEWANIDPFELFFTVEKGSGYDIACAKASQPVLYKFDGINPLIRPVRFNPPFLGNLYLTYLGKKQNTAGSIKEYRKQGDISPDIPERMNQITSEFYTTKSIARFCELMDEHEEIIASVIHAEPLKHLSFSDFPGSVKSLGAWGGDFALVASTGGKSFIKDYFKKKGYITFFELKELALL